LDVRHPDAVPVRTELRLTAARQDLRFELRRAHAVTLRALDRDGTPIGATLYLLDAATHARADAFGSGVERDVLGVGHERVRGLRAGAYLAGIEISGRRFEQGFTVPAGAPVLLRVPELVHEVALSLPPDLDFGFFGLRLVDAAGRSTVRPM